jgi:hypothetical protein
MYFTPAYSVRPYMANMVRGIDMFRIVIGSKNNKSFVKSMIASASPTGWISLDV